MKKFVLAAALAALTLAGCEQLGPKYEELRAQLTAAIVKVCAFVPTPGTIDNLLDAWDVDVGAAATTFDAIAHKVCTTVGSKAVGPDGNWVVIGPDGEAVEIEGAWAR